MAPTRHSSTHQCSLIFVPAKQKAAADWSKRQILDCDWPSYGTGHEVSLGLNVSWRHSTATFLWKKIRNNKIEQKWRPIRTKPYFAKSIDRCVNHKLSRVRTDDNYQWDKLSAGPDKCTYQFVTSTSLPPGHTPGHLNCFIFSGQGSETLFKCLTCKTRWMGKCPTPGPFF